MIQFDNSWARDLPGTYLRVPPDPAPAPRLLVLNRPLAVSLGLDLTEDQARDWFSGASLPPGADPIAQAYAGHQFGGFSPQLGDGRAHLLGEIVTPDDRRFDIQLKGSGRTPFSRGGDGKAAIGPMLREYLVSEFMAATGVPTTRALAVVATGQEIWRETKLPGAVLARVAASHLRVGTFQFFAARGEQDKVKELANHAIARHYPDLREAATPYLALLDAVIARQAALIASWMGLGFIHGVMNTDNMAISGETIDYGPCAFMDAYHPDTVFSSIDSFGRYAWSNQPNIAAWNLAQLAMCLIPLMGDEDAAIKAATDSVHRFKDVYEAEWLRRFGAKIGLSDPTPEDAGRIERFLTLLAVGQADFTRSFRALADGDARVETGGGADWDAWHADWQVRIAREPDPRTAMRAANPWVIPRNHRVEEAIAAAVAGDLAPFRRLHGALSGPFDEQPENRDLTLAPRPDQRVRATFCGT